MRKGLCHLLIGSVSDQVVEETEGNRLTRVNLEISRRNGVDAGGSVVDRTMLNVCYRQSWRRRTEKTTPEMRHSVYMWLVMQPFKLSL